MTNDQISAKLDELSGTLKSEFARLDVRLTALENTLSPVSTFIRSFFIVWFSQQRRLSGLWWRLTRWACSQADPYSPTSANTVKSIKSVR